MSKSISDIAKKYGWDGKSSLTDWLEETLLDGSIAKAIVTKWEEDSLVRSYDQTN